LESTVRNREYRRRSYHKKENAQKDNIFIIFLRQLILCLLIFSAIYVTTLYNAQFKQSVKSVLEYSIDFKQTVLEITEVFKNVLTKAN